MPRRRPLLAGPPSLRALVVLGLLLILVTCRDGMAPEARFARVAIAPVLPSEAALGAFGLSIDRVRFVVVRPLADTLADTTVDLPPEVTELALDIRVPLVTYPETLSVSVVALAGTVPLFTGTSRVRVPTPSPPPEVPITTYIGPVVDSVVILPRAPFVLLNDSLRFQVQGFNGGVPVSQLYVAWETSDATAPISTFGVLHAPAVRGGVRVRARTPSGASDSVTATFTPPATQLLAFAGGGQIDTVGQLLAVPLEVLARAADGLGVGGVPVHFRALAGGGSVTDSVVVTDSIGHARTTVTVGALLGGQTFEAAVAGLTGSPVTFSAVALAGPPAQLLAVAGDLQLATVATALLTRPAVLLKDAGGNPVAGASVTFTVSGGGGSLTGGTQLTNAAGVATVGSWTLGTLAGSNTITASVPGVTPVVFTATGLAGAAASIVKVTGDLQSAVVNTVVPAAPQVRIADQFGNPVPGTTVSAAIASGAGSIANSAPVSDASGLASVGSWRLGTLVGANAVVVSGTGLAGSPMTFSATGLVDVTSQMAAFAGNQQTALVGAALSFPPVVRVSDQFGNPVAGVTVSFVVASGGGSPSIPVTATSDTAGLATGPTWTLGTVAGLNTLTATAAGLPTVTFTAEGLVSAASSITMGSGNLQSGVVATTLPTAYSVVVRSLAGAPVQGVPVSWAAAGGGSITPTLDTTDAAGMSTAVRTLGTVAGTQTATASVGGLSGSPVSFTATALPDVPAQLVKLTADPQSATVATAVAAAPSVRVVDRWGNAVAAAIVGFTVASGGGAVAAGADTSDALGVATGGAWTLGTLAGTLNNALSVSATGVPAVSFQASGIAGAPDHLAFLKDPAHSLAGDTIRSLDLDTIRVAIQDKFSNVVVPAKDVVTLGFGVTPDSAAKPLNATAAAVNGVATFPDLAIDSAGVGYTLIATAGSLTGPPTKPFDIGGVFKVVPVTKLGPVAAALNTATRKIYVAGASLVSVLLDDRELLQVPGFESPFDVAANAASSSNKIYVSTLSGLAVIDGNLDVVRGTVAVGTGATGIAVDTGANRIYVAVGSDPVQRGAALVPVDGSKDVIVAAVDIVSLPAPGEGVAFDPKTGLVYVAIPSFSEIAVIDPTPGKATLLAPIHLGKGGAARLALDASTNLLWVTNRDEGTVSVIDLASRKETRLAVGRSPEAVSVDAARRVVYVANSGESTVSLIDATTFTVFATLTLAPPPTVLTPKALVVDPGSGQVYVPTKADDLVRVIQP